MKMLIIVLAVGFFVITCVAQTNATSSNTAVALKLANVFREVKFSTMLKNNVVVAGSTNILQCKIVNNSTSAVCYASAALIVYLTNNVGTNYTLIEASKARPHKMSDISSTGSGISFLPPLEIGESKTWAVPLVINSNVLTGDYQIVASQIVLQPDTMLAKYITFRQNVNVVKK